MSDPTREGVTVPTLRQALVDLYIARARCSYYELGLSESVEREAVAKAATEELAAENRFVYEELSKALGSHAPKAWDRIRARLEEWRVRDVAA